MEDITNTDYTQGKRVSKDFKIKKIKKILWFLCSKQCITVSWCIGRHWKYGLEKYEFHSAPFLTAKRLVNSLKNYQSKIRYFNWYWYDVYGWKGIRGGICHPIHRYAKANNKYMKDYNKNKELSYLKNWDVNNLYSWAMSQNFPVNDSKNIEDIFDKSFVESYNKEIDLG